MGPVGMDRSIGFSGFFALRLGWDSSSSVGANPSDARTTGSGATTFFTIGDRTSVGVIRNRPARFFFGVGSLGRGRGTPPPAPPRFAGAGAAARGCGRLLVFGAGVGGLGMVGTGALRGGAALDLGGRPAGPEADLPLPCAPFWRSGRTGRLPTSPRFSVRPNSPEEPVIAYLPCGPATLGAAGFGEVGRVADAADGDGFVSLLACGLGVGLGRRYLATGSTSPGAFFFFAAFGLRWGAGWRRFSPNRSDTGPSPTAALRDLLPGGAQGSSS